MKRIHVHTNPESKLMELNFKGRVSLAFQSQCLPEFDNFLKFEMKINHEEKDQ
jgi:hypothetical protein